MKANRKRRKRVLFVCTGNTCRSPMAEAILRRKIKDGKIKWWDVSSCGIHAETDGGISANSLSALAEIGIDFSRFIPRQLTKKIIGSSTIVICMTEQQKHLLEEYGNVCCVRDICGYDIPDPYGGNIEVYRKTREAIESACDKIIEKHIREYKEEE